TNALCAGLEPEDYVVQSMPDVSPTKWHLAHTTWFFETFILKKLIAAYQSAIPDYAYLFNSYYNAAGTMHRRDLRGLISRPTVEETRRYRSSIDQHMDDLLSGADEKLLDEIEPVVVLGIHHEQQHQELLVTDIKHVFARSMIPSPSRTSVISKPMLSLTGAAHDCPPNSNGNARPQICRLRVTSSRPNAFIHKASLALRRIEIFAKCSAMFGNGRVVL